MNANSIVALEYIFILNSEIQLDECVDMETEPPGTTEDPTEEPTTEDPTEEPTTEDPTEEPTTEDPTEEPTTEDPTEEPATEDPTEDSTTEDPTEDPTTEDPTEEPATEDPTEDPTEDTAETPSDDPTGDPGNNVTTPPYTFRSSPNFVWVVLSVLFLVTTVLTIVAMIYFIWLYRNVMSVRSKIISVNDKPATNLPRLIIMNNANGDQVIVGVEKRNSMMKSSFSD